MFSITTTVQNNGHLYSPKKQQDRQKHRLYTVDKNMYIYNMNTQSQDMLLKGSPYTLDSI